jgi:hypothetical protein
MKANEYEMANRSETYSDKAMLSDGSQSGSSLHLHSINDSLTEIDLNTPLSDKPGFQCKWQYFVLGAAVSFATCNIQMAELSQQGMLM